MPPIRLTDQQVGYKYVEFPDDVFYMESISINNSYRSDVAYVPVQRWVNGVEESHLYKITARSQTAQHIAGPIAAPDNSTDVTVFGSALSDAGILYLCAWNRNSILVCDLERLSTVSRMICATEITGITAPNNVAVDGDVLYVAGGSSFGLFHQFSNAAFGQIFKVELGNGNRVSVVSSGHTTLAGIEVFDNQLYVSQLFDIFKTNPPAALTWSQQTVWHGLDETNQVWLADNIDVFDSNYLICPAFSTTSAFIADHVMAKPKLATKINLLAQLITKLVRGESLGEALLDPEVDIFFSNTFIQEGKEEPPVKLVFLKGGDQAVHFEIDLVDTRAKNPPREVFSRDGRLLGMRHFFNDQVTHAAQLPGYIACVNFEQPRILLLGDQVFRDNLYSWSARTGSS